MRHIHLGSAGYFLAVLAFYRNSQLSPPRITGGLVGVEAGSKKACWQAQTATFWTLPRRRFDHRALLPSKRKNRRRLGVPSNRSLTVNPHTRSRSAGLF